MKTRLLDEFRIGPRKVTIRTGKGDDTFEVWVRRPNGPEKQMIEAQARASSRDLRKLLDNKKSREFTALVRDEINGATDEELQMIYMASEIFERTFKIERQTLEDRDQTFVPEPESTDGVTFPSQQDLDRHEDAKENAEEEREEAVEQARKSIATELQAEAASLKRSELEARAYPRQIEILCGQAYNEAYTAFLMAYGTYEDAACKSPMFRNVDEVRDLFRDRPDIAQQIGDSHGGLIANPEEVKI